jgi:hypothetical protein
VNNLKISEMKFIPNRAGIRELSTSMLTKKALNDLAQHLAERAQANGSVFTRDYTHKSGIGEDGAAIAYAYTDYPFAHWDEWGTIRRTPVAPMRRAIHSAGLWSKFQEIKK